MSISMKVSGHFHTRARSPGQMYLVYFKAKQMSYMWRTSLGTPVTLIIRFRFF